MTHDAEPTANSHGHDHNSGHDHGSGHGHGHDHDHEHRDYTLDECAKAAGEVLDQLGITEPVDGVGNAWGGHVGITLAVSQPHRLRSLVTIAAPVTPVGRRQRCTQTYPLALLYRLLGANRFITKALFDALLGANAIAAHPDRAAEIMSAFKDVDRESIRRTIRFMHSWRDLTDKLPAARRRRRCRPCRRQSRWSAAGCVVDVARATFQDQPQRPLQLISETEDRQE